MDYATPLQVFFNIIIFALLFFILRKSYNMSDIASDRKPRLVLSVSLILIFCLFSYWGPDYFHYLTDYESVKYGVSTNMEDFYHSLITMSSTYTIFRFFIWGSALLFLVLTFKNCRMKYGRLFFIFSMLYLPWFSYARVSSAIALDFLALSIIARNNINFKSVITAGLLLYLSLFLHKTAFFGVAIVLFAVIFKNIPKKAIPYFVLVVAVIIFYIIRVNISTFLYSDVEDNYVLSTGQSYLDSEYGNNGGLGIIIHDILQRTPYYLLLLLYFLVIKNNRYQIKDEFVKYFGLSLVVIVVFSTIFLFDFGANTYVLYYRFLNFGMVPATIFIAYCKENGYCPKLVDTIVIIGTLASVYSLSYSFYNRL